MATARLVMTMAIVGAAGGAALALTLVPGFAPYAAREARAPVTLQKPISDAEAYGYAPPARAEGTEQQDFAARLGDERGAIVIEVPRWAGETAAWMTYGQRTFEDWSSWAHDMERRAQELAGRQPRDDEDYGYAPPRHQAPYDYAPRRFDDRQPRGSGTEALRTVPDAAAEAAEQAREAARDVEAAEAL